MLLTKKKERPVLSGKSTQSFTPSSSFWRVFEVREISRTPGFTCLLNTLRIGCFIHEVWCFVPVGRRWNYPHGLDLVFESKYFLQGLHFSSIISILLVVRNIKSVAASEKHHTALPTLGEWNLTNIKRTELITTKVYKEWEGKEDTALNNNDNPQNQY